MKRFGVWAGFLVLLFAWTAQAQSNHKFDPVVVQGVSLPAVLGAKPSELRLFAYDGKNFQPIIYQVDERYDEMLYWQWTRRRREMVYALSMGPKAKPDPNPYFDRDDELAFMSWDAGPKAPEGAGPSGSKVCQEIKVTAPDTKESRYGYLCRFDTPPPARDDAYVFIGGDNNQVIGKSYKIGYPQDEPLFADWLQLGPKDKLGPNLLDRFKVNYDVNAALGFFRYALTNEDIHGYVRGLKAGPVRIIKEVVSVTESWPHVQNRLLHHVYYYPCHIEWEMETRAPIIWGEVHKYDYALSLDLNPVANGSKFYSEKNQAGVAIDGITDENELKMDYGPQQWVAVSTRWGTIYNHLALPPQARELYRDIYFADMAQKPDQPENYPGEFGKFGFIIHNLQKTGRKFCTFREMYFFSPEPYQPGAEKPYLEIYTEPMTVESSQNSGYAIMQSLPSREEDRSVDDMPIATNSPKLEKKQVTQYVLPNFMIDPYNTGYGAGASYGNQDVFKTGIGYDIFTLFTTRNYYNIDFSIYKLRFITFVENTEFSLGVKQFPSEIFYGIGDTTDTNHEAIYWWTRNEGTVSFKKHFSDHYGVDTQLFYRDTKIRGGQQPVEGTQKGKPSFETHFGYDNELDDGERWGGPLWGRQGGHTNGFNVGFYRDMRDDVDVPHRGDYESISVYRVGPEMDSDYEYTKLAFDLRKYFEPSWLQDLPMDQWFSDKRTTWTKFFGPTKHRNFSFRATGQHTFSKEFDYYGNDVLDVPFYEMTGMGGGSSNRGYFGNRFRDNDVFLLSGEYRWQYWRFFDTALFVDYGLVMRNMLENDSWNNPWHTSYGVSLRAHIPPGLWMTLEYIWSEDFPGGFINQCNFTF